MRRNIRDEKMTKNQLCFLAHQTCQWWNAVFVQTTRFFDALESENGKMPWDSGCEESAFIAERLFLITAVYHAIEHLQKLDVEVQREKDSSIEPVLHAIESAAPFNDIKNLRDMNEHGLDYLMNKGQNQSKFCTVANIEGKNIPTTAAWTQIRGDLKLFMLGNVDIIKLLTVMKANWPFVRRKTEEIFNVACLDT